MDVSGVSQPSAQAAPSTYFQQRAVDLVKLGQALESGNSSTAPTNGALISISL